MVRLPCLKVNTLLEAEKFHRSKKMKQVLHPLRVETLPKPANGQIVNEPLFLSGFAFFDERFPGGHGDATVGEWGR